MKYLMCLLALCSVAHAQIMSSARRAASVAPMAAEEGTCSEWVTQTDYNDWFDLPSGNTISQKIRITASTDICKARVYVYDSGSQSLYATLSSAKNGGGTVHGTSNTQSVGGGFKWVEVEFDPAITVTADCFLNIHTTTGLARLYHNTTDSYEGESYFYVGSEGTERTTWDLAFELDAVQ